jgi:hypothetical protein
MSVKSSIIRVVIGMMKMSNAIYHVTISLCWYGIVNLFLHQSLLKKSNGDLAMPHQHNKISNGTVVCGIYQRLAPSIKKISLFFVKLPLISKA